MRKALLNRGGGIQKQSIKLCYVCAKGLVKDMTRIKIFNILLLLSVKYKDAVPLILYGDAVELHYRAVHGEAYIADMEYIADL